MNAQIVSFHCVVKDKQGRVISSTYNQDVLTYDENQKDVLIGLAKGLQNLTKGEKRRIVVSAKRLTVLQPEPSEAMFEGGFDPQRKCPFGRQGDVGRGDGPTQLYRVTEIQGDNVTLDANHPLAGQDLVFEIEATAARLATPEDLIDDSVDEKSRYH